MRFLYKPGDRVRIKRTASKNQGLCGTIVSGGFLARVLGSAPGTLWTVYNVNWDDGTKDECGREVNLERLYDGNVKVSWASCAWRPDPLIVGVLDVPFPLSTPPAKEPHGPDGVEWKAKFPPQHWGFNCAGRPRKA